MTGNVHGETLKPDDSVKDKINTANKTGRLSRIFAAATTAGIAAFGLYYGLESAQGAISLGDAALQTWSKALIVSMISGAITLTAMEKVLNCIEDAMDNQCEKFIAAHKNKTGQVQDMFIETLHQRSGAERKLSDQDLSIIAMMPEEKLGQLPDWVSMNALKAVKAHQDEMENFERHLKDRFDSIMDRQVYQTVKSLEDSFNWTAGAALITGLLPLYHALRPVPKVSPEQFEVPAPHDPDLRILALSMKSGKALSR
ncbi:MAG: hypothetical protein H6867_00980 [Rhodospirillales bacterium]|nr:hypothetical protein [Rhodospirillales bacterium]MCB9996765.1 hypothetical protein [Rhodospirillales bacterium]